MTTECRTFRTDCFGKSAFEDCFLVLFIQDWQEQKVVGGFKIEFRTFATKFRTFRTELSENGTLEDFFWFLPIMTGKRRGAEFGAHRYAVTDNSKLLDMRMVCVYGHRRRRILQQRFRF